MSRLRDFEQQPFDRLVISVDADSLAGVPASILDEVSVEHVLQWVRAVQADARQNADNNIVFADGQAQVSLVNWRVSTGTTAGVPNKQTLERVLCAALVAAHPERGDPIERWLASRPNPPPIHPKEHAFSYLAGWRADSGGYEGAIAAWWNDERVAAELEKVLDESGTWELMRAIAGT